MPDEPTLGSPKAPPSIPGEGPSSSRVRARRVARARVRERVRPHGASSRVALGKGGLHWDTWRLTGNKRELEKFLAYYHAWARKLATSHARKRKGVSLKEAYQDSLVGLWWAAVKWDPSKSSFTHYSKFWIVRELHKSRDADHVYDRIVAFTYDPSPSDSKNDFQEERLKELGTLEEHQGEARTVATEDLLELYEDYGFTVPVRVACDAMLSGWSLEDAADLATVTVKELRAAIEKVKEGWCP